jgi:hypothetical protein
LAQPAFQPVSFKSASAPYSLAQLLLHFGPTAHLGPNRRPTRPGPLAAVALRQPARSPSGPSRCRPPPRLRRSPALVRIAVRIAPAPDSRVASPFKPRPSRLRPQAAAAPHLALAPPHARANAMAASAGSSSIRRPEDLPEPTEAAGRTSSTSRTHVGYPRRLTLAGMPPPPKQRPADPAPRHRPLTIFPPPR